MDIAWPWGLVALGTLGLTKNSNETREEEEKETEQLESMPTLAK